MKVLTFFNHAGGAAKTSSTRDIGYELAQFGFRVLLIDLDPQANLTAWLGVPDAPLARTAHATLVQGDPLPEPYRAHGLDLVASTLALAAAEAQLPGVIGGFGHLRSRVRDLDRYDFVLIDSPPSLGQLSLAAAVAADALVVPVPTTHKGVSGVIGVHEMVTTYRKLNAGLHVAFYLPTLYNAQTVHGRESLEWIRENLRPVGSAISFRPAVYPDAHAASLPVAAYQPHSPAAGEIRRATEELLAAIGVEAPRAS